MEWVDHLQSIISISLMLFLIFILIMLIHPKWRKKITEPDITTRKQPSVINLSDLLDILYLPIKAILKLFSS